MTNWIWRTDRNGDVTGEPERDGKPSAYGISVTRIHYHAESKRVTTQFGATPEILAELLKILGWRVIPEGEVEG